MLSARCSVFVGSVNGSRFGVFFCFFFFQAEDGIRDLVRSRGLGDVYKRQAVGGSAGATGWLSSRTRLMASTKIRLTPVL